VIGIAAIVSGLAGLAAVARRHNRLPLNLLTGIVLGSALALVATPLLLMRRQNLVGEAFDRHRWLETAAWACATVLGAVLALVTEMTALQSAGAAAVGASNSVAKGAG
jgi:hypothetical protein